MYRQPSKLWQVAKEDQEVVIAIDAATGKTVWEHAYDAPVLNGMNLEHGPGPHSTPLVVGDGLFTVGATGKFHALDKNSGRVLWSHDFFQEFGVVWKRGYSCSPIAYKNLVIVTLGKAGRSVIAFRQSDGSIAWQKQDFDYGFSSPILVSVKGSAAQPSKSGKSADRQEQLVVFMAGEIAGLDPNNGELLWRHPHVTNYGLNISTPVWIEGNLLFCSSAYNSGSRLLQLTLSDGKTTVKELWFNNRMRIHFGNAIRLGDYIYGSSGDFGPAFLSAVEIKTGEIAWRDRSFSRASLVYADDKLIVLDEDGNLGLAILSPQGLKVHSKVELFSGRAWTPPTLAGTRLYARDRKMIVALDLG